jgi:hypothetical protein
MITKSQMGNWFVVRNPRPLTVEDIGTQASVLPVHLLCPISHFMFPSMSYFSPFPHQRNVRNGLMGPEYPVSVPSVTLPKFLIELVTLLQTGSRRGLHRMVGDGHRCVKVSSSRFTDRLVRGQETLDSSEPAAFIF